MNLDDYFRRFPRARRVTLVGPLPPAPPDAESFAEPVVWVDGGADHRGARGGFAVGDGDSARARLDQYLQRDKDFSDLAYVLQKLPAQFREVVLRGFLGARRDHELFNLGEVHRFLAAAESPVRARFDHSVFGYAKGEWRFCIDGVFSLGVVEATAVTLDGACEFHLPPGAEVTPLSSRGLSNRGFGEIRLRAQAPVFIFRAQ